MAQQVKIINDKARFSCPECKKGKTVNVAKYKNSSNQVKVNCKCSCGNTFQIFLDRRRAERKELVAPGMYSLYMNGERIHRDRMIVLDLSTTGIKIQLHDKCSIEPGDIIVVTFNQIHGSNAAVTKEAIVRRISNLEIGAEFRTELDKHLVP